jgi:hypothetical protein
MVEFLNGNGPMEQEKALKEILETVSFLRDHAVTKEEAALKSDLEAIRSEMALKSDLEAIRSEMAAMKGEIITHIDGFVVLHQKLDTELTALRAKSERLEDYIQQIVRHLQLKLQ